jgi:hypothetical protein
MRTPLGHALPAVVYLRYGSNTIHHVTLRNSSSAFCYDETRAVAKAYTAACTPDFFLFGQQRTLVYRGKLDASRPDNQIPVTGKDLWAAIEALLADQPINPSQKPSLGCNIKWKKGNEPVYFLSQ